MRGLGAISGAEQVMAGGQGIDMPRQVDQRYPVDVVRRRGSPVRDSRTGKGGSRAERALYALLSVAFDLLSALSPVIRESE